MGRGATRSPLGLPNHSQYKDSGNSILVSLRHEAIIPTEMNVRTTVSGSTYQVENDELMLLSLDLLDKKREDARLRNWSYQQDVAKNYNKKVRTMTFQQGG